MPSCTYSEIKVSNLNSGQNLMDYKTNWVTFNVYRLELGI